MLYALVWEFWLCEALMESVILPFQLRVQAILDEITFSMASW